MKKPILNIQDLHEATVEFINMLNKCTDEYYKWSLQAKLLNDRTEQLIEEMKVFVNSEENKI